MNKTARITGRSRQAFACNGALANLSALSNHPPEPLAAWWTDCSSTQSTFIGRKANNTVIKLTHF